VLVLTLLPVYSLAPAVVQCRFGWSSTAAFLAPAGSGWGFALAVIGGLCIGGAPSCALVVLGASRRVVVLGSSLHIRSLCVWRVTAAALVCGATLAILVIFNAGFVLLEESTEVSDKMKIVVLVLFAMLHEIVDGFATPYIVSVVVIVATDTRPALGGVHPSAVFAAAVAVGAANSVLAPVIALLGVGDGCFRDQLFESPVPVETSVDVPYCTGPAFPFTEAQCLSLNWQWVSMPVGVSFTPPFRFDGERCISSVITLYTPAYLVAFAIRILYYPAVAWWLARRGIPWTVRVRCIGSTLCRCPLKIITAVRRLVDARRDETHDSDMVIADGSARADAALAPIDTQQERMRSPTSVCATLKSRKNRVPEVLDAIGPATERFNLLVIATGPGMFAPAVAAGAVLTLASVRLLEWSLVRRFGPNSFKPNHTHIQKNSTHCIQEPAHTSHPLPLVCVVMLLLFNTISLCVILSASGLGWAGWAASAVNWMALGVSCWRSWENLCGRASVIKSTSGLIDMPIELTEMLISPEYDTNETEYQG
jgi:hypothetical protein